ncbi:MAG: 50S ribosomal protein L25/general stress protein Ctc [Bacteroidetes bacterium]|nr:50S ribosomal protein L25/general stress protein Ctc [Bacteroidota bacterium]
MKIVSMSGSPRENVGKKDAKILRRQGLIPCVLYGGKEQYHFTLTELQFRDVVFVPDACLIKLSIDKKEYKAILQDIQFHPVTDRIIHADFLEVIDGKPIKIEVPIKLKGSSPGVIKGGKLHIKQRKLKVRGLADIIPAYLDVDISKLDIGGSIIVGELAQEGLEFLNVPNSVLVMVKTTRVAAAGPEDGTEESAAGDNPQA